MDGPEQVSLRLVAMLDAGDLDGAVALYEEGAVFCDAGRGYRGHDAIREVHREFVESGLRLTLHDSVVFAADDIALVHWSWTVTRPGASAIDGVSAEVLRRRPDGEWKFVVDNSDGSAVMGLAAQ